MLSETKASSHSAALIKRVRRAQLVECRTGKPGAILDGFDSPVQQAFFSFFLPVSVFSADSLTVFVQPTYAIASVNICVHEGDNTCQNRY